MSFRTENNNGNISISYSSENCRGAGGWRVDVNNVSIHLCETKLSPQPMPPPRPTPAPTPSPMPIPTPTPSPYPEEEETPCIPGDRISCFVSILKLALKEGKLSSATKNYFANNPMPEFKDYKDYKDYQTDQSPAFKAWCKKIPMSVVEELYKIAQDNNYYDKSGICRSGPISPCSWPLTPDWKDKVTCLIGVLKLGIYYRTLSPQTLRFFEQYPVPSDSASQEDILRWCSNIHDDIFVDIYKTAGINNYYAQSTACPKRISPW